MAALNDLMGLIPEESKIIASAYLNRIENFNRERLLYTREVDYSYLNDISRIAAQTFGCLEMNLYMKDRAFHVVNARRFVFVYLVRELGWTLNRAGSVFNKTHTDARHAIVVFDGWYETDKAFKEQYEQFKKQVNDKLRIDVSKSASDTRAVPTDVLIHRTVNY